MKKMFLKYGITRNIILYGGAFVTTKQRMCGGDRRNRGTTCI